MIGANKASFRISKTFVSFITLILIISGLTIPAMDNNTNSDSTINIKNDNIIKESEKIESELIHDIEFLATFSLNDLKFWLFAISINTQRW